MYEEMTYGISEIGWFIAENPHVITWVLIGMVIGLIIKRRAHD